jgi:hypothetical protein
MDARKKTEAPTVVVFRWPRHHRTVDRYHHDGEQAAFVKHVHGAVVLLLRIGNRA